MHVASPFTREASDFENDFLIPAIKGTTTILEAASLSPSVQRVIVTSSFAAMLDMSRGLRPGYTYSEADFNPETYEGAKACESAGWAYCASKGLAEKAAWKYLEDHKPHFTLSVINPPKIIGPSIQELSMSLLCTSMKDIYPLINGSLTEAPKTTVWGWVDVRDVGIAHLRALELPEAINKRFLLTEGTYTFQNICGILRDSPKIPDSVKAKIPLGSPGQDNAGPHVYDLENSRSKKVLGMQYRTLEESVVDTALNLLASE
jgi:nucleoside-diphosphate-sugar epimerase